MTLPAIYAETEHWALILKPHGLPTAPLVKDEPGTLLEWFLDRYPECTKVHGRKDIEHGLVHRLDTGTAGLVLIAKTQMAMDFFCHSQQKDMIIKRYTAFCGGISTYISPNIQFAETVPFTISSQFRAFGPGRKEVRTVFPGERHYNPEGTFYSTTIESVTTGTIENTPCRIFECSLTRGFRHQVRAHLSALGFPILGDTVYNKNETGSPMRLYASGISFSDPGNPGQVSFSLPQPDKMIR